MKFGEIMLTVCALGLIGQIYLSTRKSVLFGFILPLLAFTQVIYWSGNPIPEGQHPTMTALNMLPWLFVVGVYLLTLLICRIVRARKSQHKDNEK